MDHEEFLVMEAQDVTVHFCILILVGCLVATAYFFPRITLDSPLAQPQVPIVPELAMVETRNPFMVKVLNPSQASMRGGIRLLLKASVDAEVWTLWLVDCTALQQALQECSTQLLLNVPGRLTNHCLHCSPSILFGAGIETELALALPADTLTSSHCHEGSGPQSRTKYPLCLIIRTGDGEGPTDPRPKIVGAVYIFHLPENSLEDSCQLVSHLIISDAGQVCDLQKLYMSNDAMHSSPNSSEFIAGSSQLGDSGAQDLHDEEDGAVRDGTSPENSEGVAGTPNGCVVCQNGSASIALLPCRHACVCSLCFPLINNACPMCRAHIDSFFLLGGQGIGPGGRGRSPGEGEWAEGDGWPSWLSRSSERLNRWLGFDN